MLASFAVYIKFLFLCVFYVLRLYLRTDSEIPCRLHSSTSFQVCTQRGADHLVVGGFPFLCSKESSSGPHSNKRSNALKIRRDTNGVNLGRVRKSG